MEAILIAQWAHCCPDCEMWNHSTSVHNWRYWQQRLGGGYYSKKYELWKQWSIDIAVSCTLTKCSDLQSENTRFKTLWLSPLTRIHIAVADSSVLPLLFLSSLSIISGCPVIKICSCYQYRKLYWVWSTEFHPHIGFHSSKLLTYLCHNYSNLYQYFRHGFEWKWV